MSRRQELRIYTNGVLLAVHVGPGQPTVQIVEALAGDDVVRAEVTTSAEDTRELTFTFEISTTLGAGDEVNPTMRYVGDWLNDNNYGHRQVGPPVLTSSPPVFPLGYVPDAQ